MATDVLCKLHQRATQCLHFLPHSTLLMLGRGPAFLQVWVSHLGNLWLVPFPQSRHLLGPTNPHPFNFHCSGSTPFSPFSGPLWVQFRSVISHPKYYKSLIKGLPSSLWPPLPHSLLPLLFILHKSCPECNFLKWNYDDAPPILHLQWLPINLQDNP